MQNINEKIWNTETKKDLLWNAIIILVFSVAVLLWGQIKSVNFCDEVYSYILSNSQNEFLAFQLEGNHWYENGDTIHIMAAEHGFDFRQVMINNKGDVHPPIYYFVIHFLSVLCAGSISKWIGIAANWIFGAVTLLCLYTLMKKLTNSRIPAVLMCAIFITSPALISMTMFLRMYAMFSMWVALFVLVSYQIYYHEKQWAYYVALCAITFGGFLTQYYFAVFCVLFTVFFGINKAIIDKQWKCFMTYVASLAMAVVLATLFWKTWIKHMFSGYLGGAVKNNAFDLSKFGNSIKYGLVHLFTLMYNRLAWVMGLLLLGMVIYLVVKKVKEVRYVLTLILTAVLYSMAIMHLTPTHLLSYRYFFPVVVIAYCAMVLATYWTCKTVLPTLDTKVFLAVGIAFCVLNCVRPMYDQDAVMYVDLRGTYRANMQILEDVKDIPWIYYGYENSTMTELMYDSTMASRFIMVNAMTPFDDDAFLKNNCEFILFTSGPEAYFGEDVFTSLDQWFEGSLDYEELTNKGNMTVYKVTHRYQ